MNEKILLDTDIGSDIDDAVCLAYLLANSRCDLLGITTVSGESEKRAMMASALCKVAGKDIPIFPGAEMPLLSPVLQDEAPQADALGKWDHDTTFPKGQAVQFLRDTIRQNPGEITLLTIGALTNIGLLFALDPEIPSMLKRLVMMCGMFTRRIERLVPLEWNARQDPHATAIAYRHDVDVHWSVGTDVTSGVRMGRDAFKEKAKSDLFRPVLDFADVWFEDRNDVVFHDPLAAALIFDNQICQMVRGTVEIELQSDRLTGYTHWLPEPYVRPGRHEIAVSADSERFFEHFFSVF